MLNINQNFDLKAPVFNFDRDYFNSVEELNAYDTSNVPDHFVTNVAGMLYQFTDRRWCPIIGTSNTQIDRYDINLGCANARIHIVDGLAQYINLESEEGSHARILPGILDVYGITDSKNITIDADGNEISIYGNDNRETRITSDTIRCGKSIKYSELLSNCTLNLVKKGTYEDRVATSIQLSANDADAEKQHYSGVNMKLELQDGNTININPGDGFYHNVYMAGSNMSTLKCSADGIAMYVLDNVVFNINPAQDGSEISGIKSLTAFANPSATKVWATDGSIVDLSTKANASDLDAKANASDVLLKKSTTGGYYIEENSNELGWAAFAANLQCTASGSSSFAEGCNTKALAPYTHVEGYATTANGTCAHAEGDSTQATQPGAHAEGYHTLANTIGSHAEGYYTMSKGLYSHAEGHYTETNSFAAHVQGTYNVANKNAIYSVGIGNTTTRKNAEYIYAKNTENSNNLVDDPKNGYKYLIGVGGYDGISTDNTTYKSVQEVIADLTARIEQLETKVKALEAANAPA